MRIRTGHVRNSVGGLEIFGILGDDQKTLSLKDRSGRKYKIDGAREPVTAEVFIPELRIIDLDEPEIRAGLGKERAVHDLGNQQASAAGGRPQRLAAGRSGAE